MGSCTEGSLNSRSSIISTKPLPFLGSVKSMDTKNLRWVAREKGKTLVKAVVYKKLFKSLLGTLFVITKVYTEKELLI